MRKKSLLMLFLMFVLTGLTLAAGNIGVFANYNTNCIQYIDPETQKVSGSLLKGSLGSYAGGLFDVVVTSDDKTAMVTNFGDKKIFFIDISRGFNEWPTILGEVRLPFFTEDMDLTPDDKYVLVTDGGGSSAIAVVEVSTRKVMDSRSFGTHYSNAIAICPEKAETFDGYIVMTADYFQGRVNVFRLIGTTLEFVKSFNVLPALPVNISISPDGYTAIAPSANNHLAPFFTISDSYDQVTFNSSTGKLDDKFVILPYISGQSCVFAWDSQSAYYFSNSIAHRAQIEVLNVPTPTGLEPKAKPTFRSSITARPKKGISQLFGVDTIALDPEGEYLYVSNPTTLNGSARISIINIDINTQVGYIQANGIPTGIAFPKH
jgi:hypothetical protein